MDFMMAIAAILGLGPALVLMYLVLRKYTYPAVESPFFSDPRFFSLFVVGLISGTIIFVGYTFFNDSWGSLFVAAGFALVFELVKLVVLNLKRFHGQSDTIFYGYGVGLGLGCTMAFGFIFYISSQTTQFFGEMGFESWVILIIIGISYILMQSSAGTTIGEGIARKKPWEFFFQALLISMVVQLLFVPTYTSGTAGEPLGYITLVAALLVSALFFYRTHYIKLPAIIREILRNEARRPKEERT